MTTNRWSVRIHNGKGEPLPPCAGKEAGEPPSAPCRVCGEVNQHKMSCRPANRRDAALAETAPSPLEVMRKAMESIKAFSPFAVDVRRAETALSALVTLEESIRKDERSKAATVVDGYARRETKVSVRAPLLAAAADIRGTK